MSVRRRQLQYGTLWGAIAFFVGVAATYLLIPAGLLNVERWQAAAWFFLNANGVPIDGSRVLDITTSSININLIERTGRLRALYALPPLLISFAAVLTGDSLPYTTRLGYIVENSVSASAGYVGAALTVILISGARPAVAIVILLGGLLGSGLFIGSTVANRLTGALPLFGVTTLGALALIGLAIIIGGVTVIAAVAPILAVAVGGTAVGAFLLRTVRSL
jgi:hypothetical protein